ncbi:MAG TPA: RDD family protein [Candidatus Dormibacteraeota bacterium]|jgi:uncharacterized RDD family membrane protein YckC
MIRRTMAVAAVGAARPERAEYARAARLLRVYALVLDTILVAVLSLVVNSVYGVTQVTGGSVMAGATGFASYTSSTTVAWPWLALLALVYFTVFEGMFGATPGKYFARLRVVRLDGGALELRDVVIRNLLRLIDGLPVLYLLGGASVLVTDGAQRLGDLAAGTTVVYRHRALEPGATRSSRPAVRGALYWVLIAIVLSSLAFQYFGRPPLEIAGMFNTGRLIPGATSYSLGTAQWGLGIVTYPFTTAGPMTSEDCRGTVSLRWTLLFWSESQSDASCLS